MAALFSFVALLGSPALAQTAVQGDRIVNVASVVDADSISVQSTAAQVRVRIPVPAAIEIQHFVADATGATPTPVVRGAYHEGATDADPLAALPAPVSSGATGPIDLESPVPLLDATHLHQGDAIFVKVADLDQNLDRTQRETIVVTLTNSVTGDSEVVVLTETGADTGVFVGYVPSARDATAAPFDGTLQVVEGSTVEARYVDRYDPSDVVTDSALVDPVGRVFDSRDGRPVSGASVTLVDVASGAPAQVAGDDGLATFPATVISGEQATDSAGRLYDFAPGEFRFPFVRPGTYRLEVKAPTGYKGPSTATNEQLGELSGGPFVVTTGSRGENFKLLVGPVLRLDVPLDRVPTKLWVTKTAVREVAGVGDVVPYEITVKNSDAESAAAGVVVVDKLPVGFRYERETAHLGFDRVADPAVSADGRTLSFSIGDLGGGVTATIRFAARVGAGVKPGTVVVNVASATSSDGATSNVAQAPVKVRDDFLVTRTVIVGRVTTGECLERDGVGTRGVANVRVYLEDGTFVVTDKDGLYHFEGARKGLRVVQLDLESLPDGLVPASCTKNSRFSGRAFSQYVDVIGGAMARADFHLEPEHPVAQPADVTPPTVAEEPVPRPEAPAPEPGRLSLETSSTAEDMFVTYQADMKGRSAPMKDFKLDVELADGLTYVAGSSELDGVSTDDPALDGRKLSYPLGDMPDDFERRLTFKAVAQDALAPGDMPARFVLDGTGPAGARVSTPQTATKARLVQERVSERMNFTVRPHFPSFGTELSPADRKELDAIAKSLDGLVIDNVTVVGHTDSVAISKAGQKIFADNVALSFGRAQSVGTYFVEALKLPTTPLDYDGKGEFEPIADNRTPEGRAKNRRAEITVEASRWRGETRLLIPPPAEGGGRSVVSAPVPPATPERQDVPAPADQTTAVAVDGQPTRIAASERPARPKKSTFQGGLLAPVDGDLLPDRTNSVQLKLRSHLTFELAVDGKVVSPERIGFRQEDPETGLTLYSFVGVDFGERGPHTLRLTAKDAFGNVRVDETANLIRTGEIASIRFVSADENVADGQTPVRMRFELLDSAGDLIRAATRLELREGNLEPPVPDETDRKTLEREARLVDIDKDGWVLFRPVATSGSYRARLASGNARVDAETYALPEMRDWILVGLAEGTVGYDIVAGNTETLDAQGITEDFYESGRLAFFAKGQVQGKWLVTAAFDSARTREEVGNSFFQVVDPDAYYTLYGDATQQGFEAASSRKVFVKVERGRFYAMFGDFDTGLTVTELSRYSRRLNGVKTELQARYGEVNAFGAATDKLYTRDEIPGDGTSGLYRLSQRGITANSENITMVVRDRFRSEVILSSRPLTRFTEYSIDYDAGTLFFKEPIASRDEAFNPVTLVVEYETPGTTGEHYTLGGRAGLKLLDQQLRLGASVVHEDRGGSATALYGVDARWQLAPGTLARAEGAFSNNATGTGDIAASAWLGEFTHTARRFDAKVYAREQGEGFGFGQQNLPESATRKFGVESAWRFTEQLTLGGQAFRQYALASGNVRDLAEARLAYVDKAHGAHLGLLHASDHGGVLEQSRESTQVVVGGRILTAAERLTLTLNHAQSIFQNANADFPTRTTFGAEFKLNESVSLLGAQELTWGDVGTTSNTRLGLRTKPWKGGTMLGSIDGMLGENHSRVLANLGLRQTWQVADAWRVDAGVERSRTLAGSGDYRFNPNVPAASGSSEPFTAATAGVNYQVKGILWDSRIEARAAESENKWGALTGAIAELGGGWAISGRGQYLRSRRTDALDTETGTLRFGAVFRPAFTRWTLLDRLDLVHDVQRGVAGQALAFQRVVNNFTAHWRPTQELNVAFKSGAKYVRETLLDTSVGGFTYQLGLDARYDLTKRWDVGLAVSAVHSVGAGEVLYSAGPSVGCNIAENMWLSAGYNLTGYEDKDFSASNATAHGPFVRMRFKFDQQSLTDAAKWLNLQ